MARILVSRVHAEELLDEQEVRGMELYNRGRTIGSEAQADTWDRDRQRWRSMASETVAHVYGEHSKEQKEFDHTGAFVGMVVGAPWTHYHERSLERVNTAVNTLTSLKERLALADEPAGALSTAPPSSPAGRVVAGSPSGVFIVHGRNEGVRETVARVLEQAGRHVVILHEQASRGRTLIEKFEQHAADAGYAVILLTGDDVGGSSNSDLRPRARQNVVFEMGFFYGRLGRDRVAVLFEPGVEKPSDIDGVVYVELDSAGAWRTKLPQEL